MSSDTDKGKLEIPLPRTSQKRINEAIASWSSGGYGPNQFSFESFLGGVAIAISMVEGGKQWMGGSGVTESVHKALRLLLANVGNVGEISQAHTMGHAYAEAYLKEAKQGGS